MSRMPKARTIQEFLSDDIIKSVLKQIDWQKDCLFGDTYKDICKIDKIRDAKFKIHDGWIGGEIILHIIETAPVFEFENHIYRLNLSSLYRTGLTPKKKKNVEPRENVTRIVV